MRKRTLKGDGSHRVLHTHGWPDQRAGSAGSRAACRISGKAWDRARPGQVDPRQAIQVHHPRQGQLNGHRACVRCNKVFLTCTKEDNLRHLMLMVEGLQLLGVAPGNDDDKKT